MQSLAGNISRQSIHVIGDLPVGERVEQRFTRLEASLSGCEEQRGFVLVILGVSVRSVNQKYVHSVHVVNGCGPVKSSFAAVVGCVDIGVRVDQVFHHSLRGQASGQDQRSRPIVHTRVQIRSSVPQQYLEHSHRVSSDGRVERGAAGIVLGVGIRSSVQQPLGRVRPGVPCRQMKRRLAALIRGGVQIRTLGDQVGYHGGCPVTFVLLLSGVQSSAPHSSHHQRRHPAGSSGVHVLAVLEAGRC